MLVLPELFGPTRNVNGRIASFFVSARLLKLQIRRAVITSAARFDFYRLLDARILTPGRVAHPQFLISARGPL